MNLRWAGAKRPVTGWVLRIAVVLIVLQLVLRGVLAFRGYFYWDDLSLISRAGTQNLLSPTYLFDDHDGHVMPAAFLVAGAITKLAPLNWIGPAISLVILQLLASLALLRTLHVILGWRPALLLPLTFALFVPLGLPAFAWWAAALNALPMITAMAWVCGDAILLIRTGNQRYAVTGTLVYFGGLLFFEKAAVIPVVAFVVAALLAYVTGGIPARTVCRDVWRGGFRLWVASLALTVAWIGVYLLVVDQRRWTFDLSMTRILLGRSVTHGIVPSLIGGPWEWGRWAPSSPWAFPQWPVMVVGWVALAAVVAVSLARKERVGSLWLAAAAYVVAGQVPIYLLRSSQNTVYELAQTLRYLPDLAVVLALLLAIGLCAPNRPSPRLSASRARDVVIVCATGLFVASSAYSTMTFMTIWRDNPTKSYLQNAQASLALAHATSDARLLDQQVDPLILQNVSWPENLASHVFAMVRDRPQFDSSTTDLKMFDSTGHLVAAQVAWVRLMKPGPVARCGYRVRPGAQVRLPLDGPLLDGQWTVELHYLAYSDGSITLSLSEGTESKVPVHYGLNRVFVRLPGSGDAVWAHANTSPFPVCLAAGPVGFIAPP